MQTKQKLQILAQQVSLTLQRLLLNRNTIAGAVILSGAVTAVAISVPQNGTPPSVTSISEELHTPAFEFVDPQGQTYLHEYSIHSGDTISAILARLGIEDADLANYIATDPGVRSLARSLRPGIAIVAATNRDGQLLSLTVPGQDGASSLLVQRKGNSFTTETRVLDLESQTRVASGTIRSSLFGATDEAGLPDSIATGMADIFGSKLDFRKDLRRGDQFSVVYETLYHDGVAVKTGRILAAEFVNAGARLTAVWYAPDGIHGEYFSADGQPLRQGFLRSPLEFSRITSGFSMRLHPILKQWRAHKGVDFGAPTGTRVKASADGVVDFVGIQRGYGNFIVLRHGHGISTAYGHLSRFAAGLHVGERVEQGDVIGYVGQTGWATGPHLHYEFRVDGVQKNPMTVALPSATPLSGSRLTTFKQAASGPLAQLSLPSDSAVALAK